MDYLFIALLVIGVTALSTVIYKVSSYRDAMREKARMCLHSLIRLKALLIYIQQHRGLTTGYLHGDPSLMKDIQAATLKVDNQWRATQDEFPAIKEESLFEGIFSHWGRLKDKWQNLTVTNNIEQHNRLITNLLYLIENQAENNPMLTKFARESGLDVIWKELLETIEAIGQTRAIGMGIVGAGESSTIERIQLKFLIEKVSGRLDTLEQAFEKESLQMQNKSWSRPFIRSAKEKTDELLLFIETTLLTEHVREVSSETFFELASSAITPLDKLFNEASDQIGKYHAH